MEAIIAINGFGRIGRMTLLAAYKRSGTEKVVISAPATDPNITVVMEVNQKGNDPRRHPIMCNASCTTNTLAPICKGLLDTFGTEKGLMTTIHAYTTYQQLLDFPHKYLRGARAAPLLFIPTTAGAAKAVSLVIPELAGKMNGIALRVPTPNVSLTHLVAQLNRPAPAREVNEVLMEVSKGSLKGIIEYSNDRLVSNGFNGITASTGIDGHSTVVIERFGALRSVLKGLEAKELLNRLETGKPIGAFFGNQRALATGEVTQGRGVDYGK